MRLVGLAALMIVGALAGAPAGSSAAPSAAPAAAASDATLAYYPAKARAEGVGGVAVLKCSRNERLALTGCVLVSETPQGEGFGQAALAMAALSKPNPDVDIPKVKDQAPFEIAVRFALNGPEAITPDLTQIPHLVTRPVIVAKPTNEQIQAVYPVRALSDQVEGVAVIDCRVTLQGALYACQVYREEPSGYGFGQAALDLAGKITMKPAMVDGRPIAGAEAPIAIPFRTTDPDAPLSLDLKKPGQKAAAPPP